jgi:CBS domain-containing protein
MQYNRKDYESYQDSYGRESAKNRSRDAENEWRNRGNRQDQWGNEVNRQPQYGRGAGNFGTTEPQYGPEYNYQAYYRNENTQTTREGHSSYRRSHLKCRDIMTRNVITCGLNTNLQEVARLMRDEDIGAIPVVGENNYLEGIVTDRDLIVKGLTKSEDDAAISIRDCLSTDLFTANQNDRVVDVIEEMGDNQVRRVPVVDGRNRLVGIIAMADVAKQTNNDHELAEALEGISKPASWLDRVAHFFGF